MDFAREHLKDSNLSYGTFVDTHRITGNILTLCLKNYTKLRRNVIYYASAKLCEYKWTIKLVIVNETLFAFMSANTNLENPVFALYNAKGYLVKSNITRYKDLMISEFSHKEIMDLDNKYLCNDELVVKFIYPTKSEKSEYSTEYGLMKSGMDTVQLSTDLKELYFTARNADVKLQVRGETFWLHKSVLAVRSRTFADFFHNNQLPPKKVTCITIDEDPSLIHEVIHYMYCGVIDCIDVKHMGHIYRIAHKLRIEQLSGKCEDYIRTRSP